jgi:hypothetical protein
MLSDPSEERFRKAEFQREKMLTSVKQLFDLHNTTTGSSGGDQYSLLVNGIAGVQMTLTTAP